MIRALPRATAELLAAFMTQAPPDELPELLGELERVRALGYQRIAATPPARAEADSLLSVPEVARLLDLKRPYVYELLRRNVLPSVRTGKYVRVRRSDVDAFCQGRAK